MTARTTPPTHPATWAAGLADPRIPLLWIVHGNEGARMNANELNASADAVCLRLLGTAIPDVCVIREYIRLARSSWLATHR